MPNGPQPESPQARSLLHKLVQRPEITIAYASGRHQALLLEAIDEYDLPVPDYAICDVGTTIYEIHNGQWKDLKDWALNITSDWNGKGHDEVAAIFDGLEVLTLQETEKQNSLKLSYYVPQNMDMDALSTKMQQRLRAIDVHASLIWSIDEVQHTGLLDVVPRRATKYHALQFLMSQKKYLERDTVFAGDSGNDLCVLTSGLQAVLVGNASDQVRQQALHDVNAKGIRHKLYFAQGGLCGMNGNYAAGVLEGLVHFVPQVRHWLT